MCFSLSRNGIIMSVRFSLSRDGIIMSVRFSLSRDGIIMSVRFSLSRGGIIMSVRFSLSSIIMSVRSRWYYYVHSFQFVYGVVLLCPFGSVCLGEVS